MNYDDQIIENVRLEPIKKLESILVDLKEEPTIEPKQDFDHTYFSKTLIIHIYIHESDWRRNFEYKKKFVNNTKIEYEYNKYFQK